MEGGSFIEKKNKAFKYINFFLSPLLTSFIHFFHRFSCRKNMRNTRWCGVITVGRGVITVSTILLSNYASYWEKCPRCKLKSVLLLELIFRPGLRKKPRMKQKLVTNLVLIRMRLLFLYKLTKIPWVEKNITTFNIKKLQVRYITFR